MGAKARAGLVCVGVALAGCRADPAREVEGEWTLQLTVTHPGDISQAPPGRRVQGTLVIDPRIPDIYSSLGKPADSLGFTMGRIYLDRGPMYDSIAVQRPYRFQSGMQHDIFEEAMARVDTARGFEAQLVPGVTHTGIVLRGTLSGDQATGRWIHDAYPGEGGPTGTFRMWRTPRGALTDSALHRSRRARREWDRR